MQKKGVFVWIAMALFAFVLTGCGGPSKPAADSKVVTVTFVNWVSAEEGTRDKMKDVIAQFEKENPNIKIDSKTVPVSDMMKQLTIMSTGGNPPDVAQVQGDGAITLASGGFLEPIDELLPKTYVVPQNILDASGLWKGKHYAIPWTPNENALWYNKKLMAQAGLDPNKPPKTMEELDQMVKQARERLPQDVVALQLDTTIRTIGLFDQWPFMLNFTKGVPPIDGNKVAVNSEGMLAYGEWIREQVKQGNTLPGKKYGEFRTMAAQNRLLFGFDGSYLHGVLKSLNPALTDKDIYETWGVTAIPAGANGKHYTADGNHLLVIFKASKNKEAAAKFAEYLANNTYSLTKYHLTAGFVPFGADASKRVPQFNESPLNKAFINDVLPSVISLPYGPNFAKASEILMSGVQEIITTDKPVPEILNKAQSKLEEIYK